MQDAILALADGSVFRGRSIGAEGKQCAELVFNTAMTGYQEILTDPSYLGQIVILTYPHIGNTGINSLDVESDKIQASGLVVRDAPRFYSSWRAEGSLSDYLRTNGIVAIADVDTRELTRRLRTHGSQNACIIAGGDIDEPAAIRAAKRHPSMKGRSLAEQVSIKEVEPYNQESIWDYKENAYRTESKTFFNVIAYDFGIKRNILRLLAAAGCQITVVPADTPASDVLEMQPDGVFLSNGPGDPEPLELQIHAAKAFISAGIPLFGICLGHQLLGLAGGGKTVKMKFGHHGANHPVKDLQTGRVLITSQNHGFAVDEKSLSRDIVATHRSLFDGSLQGIAWKNRPVFAFQGHPEASPGPDDAQVLFSRFIEAMRERQALTGKKTAAKAESKNEEHTEKTEKAAETQTDNQAVNQNTAQQSENQASAIQTEKPLPKIELSEQEEAEMEISDLLND